MDWIVDALSKIDFVGGLFEKFVIGVIFFFVALIFKPLLLRIWGKVWKWFKRKTGRMKYSVIVTGKVYHEGSQRGQQGFPFEVELPYKDVSEDSMPAEESDQLIYSAINKKYGTDFFRARYKMNYVKLQTIEK